MIINILGAGAFGTALAIAFSKNHKVCLITLPKFLKELSEGENKIFIPGFSIPETVEISTNISSDCEVLFVATPAQEISNVIENLNKNLPSFVSVVFCSKGLFIDQDTPFVMTEFAKTQLKNPLHVLGGPNFAHELAGYKKSFANIAGENAEALCQKLSQDHFILEPSLDVIGVQLAGFFKNVVAIACGYYEGQKRGLNEKAALFAQAFD